MAHVKVCELRSVAKGGGSGLDGRGGSGQGPFFFFLLLHHKGLNPTALGFCTCDTPYLVLTRKKKRPIPSSSVLPHNSPQFRARAPQGTRCACSTWYCFFYGATATALRCNTINAMLMQVPVLCTLILCGYNSGHYYLASPDNQCDRSCQCF